MKRRNNLKKIFGLALIGIVVLAVIFGLLSNKTKDNPNQETVQTSDKPQNNSPSSQADSSGTVCRDFFEENQEELISKGYTEDNVVDCSFVGCGGIF